MNYNTIFELWPRFCVRCKTERETGSRTLQDNGMMVTLYVCAPGVEQIKERPEPHINISIPFSNVVYNGCRIQKNDMLTLLAPNE